MRLLESISLWFPSDISDFPPSHPACKKGVLSDDWFRRRKHKILCDLCSLLPLMNDALSAQLPLLWSYPLWSRYTLWSSTTGSWCLVSVKAAHVWPTSGWLTTLLLEKVTGKKTTTPKTTPLNPFPSWFWVACRLLLVVPKWKHSLLDTTTFHSLFGVNFKFPLFPHQ